jgi:hypothetical protein
MRKLIKITILIISLAFIHNVAASGYCDEHCEERAKAEAEKAERDFAQSLFASEDGSSSSEDTWVYIGKETFNKEGFHAPLELDVWVGTIKDLNGSTRQIFQKVYKLNKFRRDSTVYPNGDWRVFEIDNISMETSEITSWGAKSLRKYDEKKRITEVYHINEKGDTLISEQYFWENGKLAKTRIDGVERVLIYGTPCDSIIVTPPDFPRGDFNPSTMYDKSFGLIPEESDPEYGHFKLSPYQYRAPPELLERQKRRCEEYKATQKKKEGKK